MSYRPARSSHFPTREPTNGPEPPPCPCNRSFASAPLPARRGRWPPERRVTAGTGGPQPSAPGRAPPPQEEPCAPGNHPQGAHLPPSLPRTAPTQPAANLPPCHSREWGKGRRRAAMRRAEAEASLGGRQRGREPQTGRPGAGDTHSATTPGSPPPPPPCCRPGPGPRPGRARAATGGRSQPTRTAPCASRLAPPRARPRPAPSARAGTMAVPGAAGLGLRLRAWLPR